MVAICAVGNGEPPLRVKSDDLHVHTHMTAMTMRATPDVTARAHDADLPTYR
jgi:hypothetical protein